METIRLVPRSTVGFFGHACVIALAVFSVCTSNAQEAGTDEAGESLNEVLHGLEAYNASWTRFSLEYEGKTEARSSETGDWRPHAIFFGGLERVGDELHRWEYMANNAASSPSVMVANFYCLHTINSAEFIRVYHRFAPPPPEILTRASIGKEDFGEITEEAVTLLGTSKSSELLSNPLVDFPFLAIDDQDILTELQRSKSKLRPIRGNHAGDSCIRLKWHNGSGERTIDVAAKLDFTPVFFDESTVGAKRLSPLAKPLARMRTTWQLLTNSDQSQARANWSRELHYKHVDGSVYQNKTTLHLHNIRRAIDKVGPLKSPPKSGHRVVIYDHQQISAEWRNGAIVRTYDGKAVERLGGVEFVAPANHARTAALIVAAGCIVLSLLFFWRRRSNATTKGWKRTATIAFVTVLSATSQRCALAIEPQYCGILAVYGAASSLGHNSDFELLIEPEFVGNIGGSSLADLEKAARRIGVSATPYQRLSVRSLQSARDPLVLHVSSPGQLEVYNHWQLFLGAAPGGARICDHDGRLQQVPWSQLLARWDGIALAVHSQLQPVGNYAAVESAVVGWWCLVGCLGVAVSRWAVGSADNRSKFPSARSSALNWLVLLCVMSCAISLLRQFGTGMGVVFGSPAVQYIAAATDSRAFPLATVEEIESAIRDPGGAIVIDARRPADFELGHIPEARSIPVDTTDAELLSTTEDWPRNVPTICYCQSARCGFDDIMAVRLVGLGFTNVRLWQPGWTGWNEHCQGR